MEAQDAKKHNAMNNKYRMAGIWITIKNNEYLAVVVE
jgi:hypothetical protein